MTEITRTKYDCFAYEARRCKILNKRYCDEEICSFYKKSTKVDEYGSGEPTEAHKKLMIRENLNPKNWIIIEENKDTLVIRHKASWKTKTIQKRT